MGTFQSGLIGIVNSAAGAAVSAKGIQAIKGKEQKALANEAAAKQEISNDLTMGAAQQAGLSQQEAQRYMDAENGGGKAKNLRGINGRFVSHDSIRASIANNQALQNQLAKVQQKEGYALRLKQIKEQRQLEADMAEAASLTGGKE